MAYHLDRGRAPFSLGNISTSVLISPVKGSQEGGLPSIRGEPLSVRLDLIKEDRPMA